MSCVRGENRSLTENFVCCDLLETFYMDYDDSTPKPKEISRVKTLNFTLILSI